MQPNQVSEYFPRVEQTIHNATQLCQITKDVPEQLRNYLSDLDRETEEAKQLLAQEGNDNRIVACVDRLEKLGDHAMQACRQAGNTVDDNVQSAVKQAHDAIADLKHRLH